jgi:polyferredoxin
MTVKREDLQAAAAAGVVHYTQVDPILIFLLKRDMQAQRSSLLTQQKASRVSVKHILYYFLAIISIAVASALAGPYTRPAIDALGVGGLLWFTGLYLLFTVAVAAWFERKRACASVRIFATSAVGLVPLAVFASQQIHIMHIV